MAKFKMSIIFDSLKENKTPKVFINRQKFSVVTMTHMYSTNTETPGYQSIVLSGYLNGERTLHVISYNAIKNICTMDGKPIELEEEVK